MLKLEKAAKTRELSVILRDKPALMSRPFLAALSYALICHLLALLIFQISPFKISYEASILSPVLVASDFFSSDPEQKITVHYDDYSHVPDYLIVPQTVPSKLPEISRYPEDFPKIIINSMASSKDAFLALEDRFEVQPMHNLKLFNSDSQPFAAHAFGAIAAKELILNYAESLKRIEQFALLNPLLKFSGPYQANFRVLVVQNRGEIIWWEALEEELDLKIKWLMISLLEDLHFEKGDQQIIENGIIEIVINFEELSHD